ncbi:hypothetical protein ABBQ32_011185 [Trebouxia sp. C0010 RCD-2024]
MVYLNLLPAQCAHRMEIAVTCSASTSRQEPVFLTTKHASSAGGSRQARLLAHQRATCRASLPPNSFQRVSAGRARPARTEVKVATAAEASTAQADTVGQEGYDVYVYEPEPLDAGESKHILSVFVADESGMINRICGVFARRGANIESLAVGLNIDKALFTIVMTGTDHTVSNLAKQLAKLVKVKYVEDISGASRVERELVLMKLRVPPGPARAEVMQLVDIFRARVVDVSEKTITLAVTGDAGKTTALQRALGKFNIAEVARTGKICLKRGEALLDMGGWGDGQLKHMRERQGRALQNRAGDGAASERDTGSNKGGSNGGAAAPSERGVDEGQDVYVSGGSDKAGVWEAINVLDAAYENKNEFQPRTLSIEVQDKAGVLNEVTGVLARRGYNIQSLAVGNSETADLSRITTVIPGSKESSNKVIKQLLKLIHIHSVTDLSDLPFITRELMLIKCRCKPSERKELIDLAEIFHGNVCDVSRTTITLEVTGKESKMRAVQDLISPYGILEVARTGRVALSRESGVNTELLGRLRGAVGKVMVQ